MDQHHPECAVWRGVQQGDGPDLSQTCTCALHHEERSQFQEWQQTWSRSWWLTTKPRTRMDTSHDDGPPRPAKRGRSGIYLTEEMHVRDENGLPLGELKVHTDLADGRQIPYLVLEPEPGSRF